MLILISFLILTSFHSVTYNLHTLHQFPPISSRAHDAQLIQKINTYLPEHDTKGLDVSIMTPAHAMRLTCERVKVGTVVLGCYYWL